MAELTLKIDSQNVQQRISSMANLNLEVLKNRLGDAMLAQSQHRLTEEKADADGNPWVRWSDKYAAQNPNGVLLEKSHHLLDSLEVEQGPGGVSVGSNLLYALVHLQGSADRNIPAREFLGFSDDNLEELGEITMEFLKESVR